MTKERPFLSFKNVTLKRDDKEVFVNTNWVVHNHEYWAILGPNSSGKSTLMHAICGTIPVIHGTITYNFNTETIQNPQNQISYANFNEVKSNSIEPLFYQARWNTGIGEPDITVAETLAEKQIWQRNPFEIVDTYDSIPNFDEHRNRVIDQLDIKDLLGRELRQLSNGERRKVTIARTLLRQPRLLILDDVFEGLDPDYRKHLIKLLNALMETSMSIFLVTSDPAKIPDSFSHILVVSDHKVVLQGSRKHVLSELNRINFPSPSEGIASPTPIEQQYSKSKQLIRMRNVTISYHNLVILDNVNWKVCRGERWAILGHNGAGKTTLLSLIMGDNPQAYANDIELFGWRRGSGESIWEIKKRIGWMAPELQRHYPPSSNCFDIVCSGWFDSVGLYRKCSKEQRDAAQSVMGDLKIEDIFPRHFRDISETEQRLVLLARALVKHPQILILDEPCQGLDAYNRQFVYKILDTTTQWSESLLLVTHQTDQLPSSMTHILTLENGRATTSKIQN